MKRVCLTLLVLFLLYPAVAVKAQECGDVNGDGNHDISDLVYLVEYLRGNGPAPLILANANMDNCNDVDWVDIAYYISYIFGGGSNPCQGTTDCNITTAGSVTLDHVIGSMNGNQLMTGVPIVFHLRFTNNTGNNYRTVSQGFTISSPDGADWTDVFIDTTTAFGFSDFGIMVLFNNYFFNGSVVDTMFLTAVGFPNDDGLYPGYDEIVATFRIGPFEASDIGKTIVLDSSFFAPGTTWRWTPDGYSAVAPTWGGPYTFTIVEGPKSSVTLDHVDGALDANTILTGTPVTFNLRLQNNEIEPIMGLSNGFEIYSPDGAQWNTATGDTIGTVGLNMFDLVYMIQGYSVSGSGFDTVTFGGAAIHSGGMPIGFDEVSYAITIGPIDHMYDGKTICIDSCFAPPTNEWKWHCSSYEVVPYWDGPHCFTLYRPTYLLDLSENLVEYSILEGGGNPPPTTITVIETSDQNISFDVGEYASWLYVDKSSGTTPEDFVISIDISGMSPGNYTEDITVSSYDALNSPQIVTVNLSITELTGTGIAVDNVVGEISPGSIRTDMPIVFNLRAYNNVGYSIDGVMTNGFRIFSPDGAEWTTTIPDTTGNLGLAHFDYSIFCDQYSVTGSGADTVVFGFINMTGTGMPDGYDDIAMKITIGPIDSVFEGKTICIDSSWFPPTGDWLWSSLSDSPFPPDWEGSRCYTIVYSSDPPPALGDSLIISSVSAGSGVSTIPVMTQLSQPIKGATIPIKIPEGMGISGLSSEGLITEDWDYAFYQIKEDSGFIFVALANSFGEVIPSDTTTIFNIFVHPNMGSCTENLYVHWDTALMGDVSRQLTFTDETMLPLYPGFDKMRDRTTILPFAPGDNTDDGSVDIDDLVFMVEYMFLGGPPPNRMNAMDVNGDCLGPDIADLVYFVEYQFLGGESPLCGCLFGGAKVSALQTSSVLLDVQLKNNITIITLSSEIDIKGVELKLKGFGEPINLVSDQFELIYGQKDDILRAGLLDMDGGNYLKAGEYQLLKLDGEYEIISAVVADMSKQSLVPIIGSKSSTLPVRIELSQNYPNPFNPTTEIVLSLPYSTDVSLKIFNIMGQAVDILYEGSLDAGYHSFEWDATDYSSGVYFYRLETSELSTTKKMLLMK